MRAAVYRKDFYGDDFIRDPIPHYQEMRQMGPVLWLEKQKAFAFPCYEECVAALRASDLYRSGEGLSLNDAVNKMLVGSTLNSDGELHDRRRAITARPIMPKNLEPLEAYIHDTAETLAERLAERGAFDAVSEFAQVLPFSIVVDLVGFTGATRDDMLKWAAATFNLFEGFNDRSKAAFADLVDLQAYLREYGRAEALKEGGLARRIFEVAPEHGFTQEEAQQQMRDYVNPSLDTTISATGFAAYYFAKNPDQWDAVRADPSLIPNAVEEVARLSTPIRAFSRYVDRDTEMAGVEIPGGSRAIVIYASANRDAAMWEEPDRFDVTRHVRKHLGFGHGRHTCMGLHLARREMINLLGAMAKRVKRWELIGAPEVAMNNTIRAFSSLPMRVIPG